MQIMDIIGTVNALGAIGMILVGSAWLKCYLRGFYRRSCSCRWEKE
jgi:hypothetical protein